MITREKLLKLYWKVQAVIAPSLKYSQSLYEDILKSHVNPTFVWLDLGCGHQLLPSWRSTEEEKLINRCKTIVGLDYDLESLKEHKTIRYKARGDASHLPFQSNSFDLITANMVVEHLDHPDVQFKEIYRILRPEGLFIFHTPNVFGYTTIIARLIPEMLKGKIAYIIDGREEKDVFPVYYSVNTKLKIKKFAKLTGFNIRKIKMIVTTAQSAIFPPTAILELLWIRMLMTKPLKILRPNIIAILQK